MSSPSGYHARGILIDTSGYFAVANRRDTHHHAGVRTLRQILVERRPLFTTNLILAETHALLLTRVGRDIAARVLAEIDNSRMTTIVRVGEADDARARDISDSIEIRASP